MSIALGAQEVSTDFKLWSSYSQAVHSEIYFQNKYLVVRVATSNFIL